jgi:hypothetical protein
MRTLFLSAAATLALAATPSTKKAPLDASVTAAIHRVEAGDFAAGAEALETAVATLPGQEGRAQDEAVARLYLGVAYAGLAREEAARQEFKAALDLDPRITLPLSRLPASAVRLLQAELLSRGKRAGAQTSSKPGKGPSAWGPFALLAGGAAGSAAMAAKSIHDPGPAPTPGPAPARHPDPSAALASVSADTEAAVVDVTVVGFSATVRAGCSASSWSWDFGDGSASAAQTTSHVYTRTGDFLATVAVQCQEGGTARGAASLRVKSFTGRWLAYAQLQGGYGLYDLTQTGTAIAGQCAPCWGWGDVFVGPITGSLAPGSNARTVNLAWRQNGIDATIGVSSPFDHISFTASSNPSGAYLWLDREP